MVILSLFIIWFASVLPLCSTSKFGRLGLAVPDTPSNKAGSGNYLENTFERWKEQFNAPDLTKANMTRPVKMLSVFDKIIKNNIGMLDASTLLPYALLAMNKASKSNDTENSTISKPCSKELVLLTEGLMDAFYDHVLHRNRTLDVKRIMQKITKWMDAGGKPGSGIMLGNGYWIGAYRECKQISESQYCISDVKVSTENVLLGLCAPHQCNENDLFTILSTFSGIIESFTKRANFSDVFSFEYNNLLMRTYGSPVVCEDRGGYSTGTKAVICVCGVLGFLILIGTFCELLEDCRCSTSDIIVNKSDAFMPTATIISKEEDRSVVDGIHNHIQRGTSNEQPLLAKADVKCKQGSNLLKFVLCFSLIKNTKTIFKTDLPKGAITAINGIRTLSMFWVILGHTFFFGLESASDNIVIGLEITQRFTFLAVANAYFSVDSFFVLSGLLVAYLSIRRFDNNYGYKFNPYFFKKFLPGYFIHRFLRLTPSYMFVILFYKYIFPLIGDGPLWFKQSRGKALEDCGKYWWTNLLYINNFYPKSLGNECLGWSWYLANDMQFYIITPIILVVMYRLRMAGNFIANGLLLAISFSYTAYLIGHYKLNSLLTGDFGNAAALGGNQAQEFADWIYVKPWCRIAPYLVGLFLGYMLHRKIVPRSSYKIVIAIFGWTIAIGLGLSVVYGPWKTFKAGGEPFTLTENVLYGTFSRFAWGVALAWVIYACHNGMGGIINKVLSWRAFIPLSRLTYSAYLVHPIIIYIYYYSLERPLHYSDISIVYWFLSFITMSYASAFLLAVAVEFPASNVESLVFSF